MRNLAESGSEGAQVRHQSGRHKHISSKGDVLFAEVHSRLMPPVLLSSETAQQLLGSVQLLHAQLHLVFQINLLVLVRLQLLFQSGQLVLDLTQRSSLLFQVRHGNGQLLLRLMKCLSLRCHHFCHTDNAHNISTFAAGSIVSVKLSGKLTFQLTSEYQKMRSKIT